MQWLVDLLVRTHPEFADKLAGLNLPKDAGQAWTILGRKLSLGTDQLLDIIRAAGIPVADLDRMGASEVARIPEAIARKYQVVAAARTKSHIQLGCADPMNDSLAKELGFSIKHPVELLFSPPDQIANSLNRFYSSNAGEAGRTLWVDEKELERAKVNPEEAIARITQHILNDAVKLGASDIHIQPFLGGGLVRYRVDGMLMRGSSLPVNVRDSVLRFILTQADLDISNHTTPQDGRLRVQINDGTYDLRISYLPSHDDSRLVIRLLNQSRNFSLEALGFPMRDQQTLRQVCRQAKGLVLFTGPTGSGKTTSLYSLLAGLNKPEINIMTAEDPVEYQLQGISQIEVDEGRGRRFDTVLKSMLRQDPDIILVGEIRDAETAQMAMRAVMTGHLVFSTVHTQDALGTIQRLVDLGVTQGQLADGLKAAVAQRMARKVCPHCAESVTERTALEQLFFDNFSETPPLRAIGCEQCHFTGYLGRFPLIEIYEPAADARARMRKGQYLEEPDLELNRSLAKVAVQAIVGGITTIDEVTRVLGNDFWGAIDPERAKVAMSMAGLELNDQRKPGFLLLGGGEELAKKWSEAIGYPITIAADGPAAARVLRQDTQIFGLINYVDKPEDEVRPYMEDLRRHLAWSGLSAVYVLAQPHSELETALKQHGLNDWVKDPTDLVKLKDLCDKALK